MKTTILNKIKAFFLSEKLRQDKKIIIFLICMAIATVFWFLNALSENYTTTLTYPVKFVNIPNNKVLVNPPPRYMKLTVNAYGFTLLRHKLRISFSPLKIDISPFFNNNGKNEALYFRIPTNRYIKRFQSQTSSEIQITDIDPDTLYFNFDCIIRKKIPIATELTYDFEKQFMQTAPVQIEPDSVWAKGPQSILDTLKKIATPPKHFKSVNKTIEYKVSLPERKYITYENSDVTVTVPVEQFTEARCEVPVHIKNMPDSVNIKTFPSKVTINYLVSLSQFQQVNTEHFQVIVNYSELISGNPKIPVKVKKSPDNILSFQYQPHEVEYLIEKN